jgi:hypothetical protein
VEGANKFDAELCPSFVPFKIVLRLKRARIFELVATAKNLKSLENAEERIFNI